MIMIMIMIMIIIIIIIYKKISCNQTTIESKVHKIDLHLKVILAIKVLVFNSLCDFNRKHAPVFQWHCLSAEWFVRNLMESVLTASIYTRNCRLILCADIQSMNPSAVKSFSLWDYFQSISSLVFHNILCSMNLNALEIYRGWVRLLLVKTSSVLLGDCS